MAVGNFSAVLWFTFAGVDDEVVEDGGDGDDDDDDDDVDEEDVDTEEEELEVVCVVSLLA